MTLSPEERKNAALAASKERHPSSFRSLASVLSEDVQRRSTIDNLAEAYEDSLDVTLYLRQRINEIDVLTGLLKQIANSEHEYVTGVPDYLPDCFAVYLDPGLWQLICQQFGYKLNDVTAIEDPRSADSFDFLEDDDAPSDAT